MTLRCCRRFLIRYSCEEGKYFLVQQKASDLRPSGDGIGLNLVSSLFGRWLSIFVLVVVVS